MGPDRTPAPVLPREVRPYLRELVRRTRAVYGSDLVGVFAVGSLALGDYRHGRSDIDITVVVDAAAPTAARHELAAAVRHPGLRCPATGLELVVYDADFAGSPSPAAGYLLNLNTGPLLPPVADFESAGSPGFWYAIDRAIGHQSGVSLFGRPVREVLAPPALPDLLGAVSDSVREHASGAGHLADNRVLNGCRTVVFCRTGRWTAKSEAGRLIAAAEAEFRGLVEAALRSVDRPRAQALALPADGVGAFLSWVRGVVAGTLRDSAG